MLSAENSGLVSGTPLETSKTVTVRITRAVMVDGQRVEVGAERSVDARFAAQLVTSGKAEKVTTPPAPPPPPDKPKQPAAKAASKD